MQNQTENHFQLEAMTEDEVVESFAIPYLTTKMLKNKRAAIANEKIYITLDPTVPATYMQQEAYLRGKLDLLNELLDTSQAAHTNKQQNS